MPTTRAAATMCFALTLSAIATHTTLADTVSIIADADTSIFNQPIESSSGQGNLFCGQTNNGIRQRALVHFNLSVIPPGATITDVAVRITTLRAGLFAAPTTLNFHRALAAWGEGASNATGGTGAAALANDATWINRVFPATPWNTPGGDFFATSSGSVVSPTTLSVNSASSPALLADVQGWHQNSATNFGWFLISASEPMLGNARRLTSRESLTDQPTLIVTITPAPPPCPPDFNGQNGVTVQDIFDFLSAWFSNDPAADFNGVNAITVQDIFDFLSAWFTGC